MRAKGGSIVPKLGLRTKFFLYSNAVVVATIALVALLAEVHDRSRVYEVAEHRNGKVTEAVAILLGDTLERAKERPLEAERFAARIDRYIARLISTNEDVISYIVVTEPHGVVTHSSRRGLVGHCTRDGGACSRCHTTSPSVSAGRRVGAHALDASCACHGATFHDAGGGGLRPGSRGGGALSRATREIVAQTGGGRTLEFRVPLEASGRQLGALSIGFSLAAIDRNLQTVPRRLLVAATLLILVNSVLTAFYMEALIRPILGLNQKMKRAGRGDFTGRADGRRRDEIGELENSFNRMMSELEEARDRERARQTQLAHAEKMAAVGTLAASVAHEVSNPLGGVLTCLENMRADPSDEEMRAKYLPLIQSGVERIRRTVANLLDFARQQPLQLESVPINGIVSEVVELAAYQLRKGGIEVRLSLDAEDPRVTADHSQMEQLFLNLVLNALQAMPDGGSLVLHTASVDGRVLVEVRDSGCGIAPEVRGRIFDPFFTTRGDAGGTGLGLAVSDNIAAAHGGEIEVTSQVGVGSVFRVWLPRLDAATAATS